MDDLLAGPPRSRPGPLGRALARVSSGVASVAAQVEPYAAWWQDRSRSSIERLAAGDGRLWLVLGDSTAQGIGASAPDRGWVGQLAEQLGSDEPWRIVNLSVSGARTADLVHDQLPRAATLLDQLGPAALVTVAVGANDAMRTANAAALRARMRRVCEALPAPAVVAALPEGISMVARLANAGLRASASHHGLRVAEINRHLGVVPAGGSLAADRFHPNDVGYAAWAAGFAEAITPR